jgi:hypothetical protein
MAKFLLGAAITALVGSSGGTTFKRNKGTNVWMNKSRGASRPSVLNNKRIANNAVIFKMWNQMSLEDQQAWNANATATKVKDKFGQDVNISGVAFSRKCYLAAQVFDNNSIVAATFSTALNPITFPYVYIDWDTRELTVAYIANSGECQVAVMLEYSNRALNAPQFTRRGVIGVFAADGDNSFTIDLNPITSLSFLGPQYNLRAYMYTCNEWGWTSVQQFTDVTDITP